MENLDIWNYSGYTHCYCEENTYRFVEKLALEPPATPEGQPPSKFEAFVCFITSYNTAVGSEHAPGEWKTAVPVVSGPKGSDVVYWDYHCLTCVKETRPPADGAGEPDIKWWVVDFDTKMCKTKYVSPVPAELYFAFTLSSAARNPVAHLEVRLRFFPAVDFLQSFRSDRRHMYNRAVVKEDKFKKLAPKELNKPGNFQHPPPATPRIQAASAAAAVLKGSISREQGKEALSKHLGAPVQEWRNDHTNNLASFLNVQVGQWGVETVGVREVGQWIKRHTSGVPTTPSAAPATPAADATA